MSEGTLPPGPTWPAAVQALAWWSRPVPFMERCRARYGKRYTIKMVGTPPFVTISDPDEVKQIFQAPPDVLHPGEGAIVLEPVVGRHSLILLDEDVHLEQRRLMLPAFHGERMKRLTGLMTQIIEQEVESWSAGETIRLHPRMQALTLEIILRAVFGIHAEDERLVALRRNLTEILEFGTAPASLVPQLRRGRRWNGFVRLREETDALIFDVIEERRATNGDREDVLAMLLTARHEDGTPMSRRELRDELMTLLVAGHETTASQLAWTFERLTRTPRVLRRLTEAVDAGDDAYVDATVNESLRHRPVLPIAEPRLVKKPVEIGGWTYPEGVALTCNAYLMHHDRDLYDAPYEFRPERFVDEQPGTYTWIPFGGGRRRCIGASFAQLEMRLVLRAVLERYEPAPDSPAPETTRRRAITYTPSRGASTRITARRRSGVRADPVLV
ncbi:MAG TPA: cytochrome P450 [Solirubrobacteraceae bacterium]|nr:cytochrome P450 [Solirubrobacteraceae bacterium]